MKYKEEIGKKLCTYKVLVKHTCFKQSGEKVSSEV